LANFDPIPNKWDLDLLNETDLIDYSSYQSGTFYLLSFNIIEYFERSSAIANLIALYKINE
jgi:hypothetical protein